MENRDRDNRETSENIERSKDESSADFGKNIGRTEDLEREPSRRGGDLEESEVTGTTGVESSEDE